MRRNFTEAERRELIQGVTKRWESVPEAAARLGVSVSTAYGWVRAATKVKATCNEPTFVQLVPANMRDARLVVRVGEVEIEVRAGFDGALLRSVVEALRGGGA
jgi:transposase-like protein